MKGKTNYGDDRMQCPMCGGIAYSDSVDVGVGLYIRGNYECSCGWEIDGPVQPELTMDIITTLPLEAYNDRMEND